MKATFSKDDHEAAKKDGSVMIVFAVDGSYAADFEDREYTVGKAVPPALAAEAVEWFRGWLKRVKGGAGKAVAP